MHILLIGERYSENLGDAVICETVKNIIQSSFKDAEIDMFDISGRINYNEYYSGKNINSIYARIYWKICGKILKYKNPPFYKLYLSDIQRYRRTIGLFKAEFRKKKYDLAIFAGGALFMDYFSGLIFYLVKKLSKQKCQIVFHACGMGVLSSESIGLLKDTFSNHLVKVISLRDSFPRFKSLFDVNCRIIETYDTALACSKYYNRSNKIIAEFGIGLINLKEYYEEQKELIYKFYCSNYSWKIFTNGGPWDYKFASSILKDIGIKDSEFSRYLINRPLNAQELVYDVTSFNQIVSYRMHSQIVAFSFLIPCYGFEWDNKVKCLFEKMNFERFCFKPNEVNDCLANIEEKKNIFVDLKEKVRSASVHSEQTLINEILFAFK